MVVLLKNRELFFFVLNLADLYSSYKVFYVVLCILEHLKKKKEIHSMTQLNPKILSSYSPELRAVSKICYAPHTLWHISQHK